ncbi:predicted protein [Plenodomus lingam JN3]|uniref:Predicted protein n=1 Tax=Leptosphaeria maculans (strain JN3 / isolate v23.1.3 / race Av1-4-5-6-7-8) TaxID=985895 RepID=E5A1A4_LEPMJ|nr:predicted protein [Plenodomus lingam JN3]CBX97368.1 predicted protein [Plenodomus lingam JN3]
MWESRLVGAAPLSATRPGKTTATQSIRAMQAASCELRVASCPWVLAAFTSHDLPSPNRVTIEVPDRYDLETI